MKLIHRFHCSTWLRQWMPSLDWVMSSHSCYLTQCECINHVKFSEALNKLGKFLVLDYIFKLDSIELSWWISHQQIFLEWYRFLCYGQICQCIYERVYCYWSMQEGDSKSWRHLLSSKLCMYNLFIGMNICRTHWKLNRGLIYPDLRNHNIY